MLSLKTRQVSVGQEIYLSDERSDVRRIIRRMKSSCSSEALFPVILQSA